MGVFQGCDVLVASLVIATSKKSSPQSPPAPDIRYFVYAANLTAGTESTEKTTIIAAGGNPGGNWTPLGAGGTATADFAFPAGMNAVLVQVTNVQAYDIDAIEGHDASDHVVSAFTTTNFADQVNNTGNIAGFPDGLAANAQATATQNAFIFQILPASTTAVVSVRVFIVAHLGTRASGDPNWITSWSRGGDQTPGGAAANSIGTVFFGATDVGTQAQWVLAVDSNGNLQTGATAILTLESGTAVSVGNISLAVDPTDNLVIANVTTSSLAAGNSAIRWRKLQPTTAIPPVWTNPPIWDQNFAGAGINLVGSNGVVLDSLHNVIIAGGNDVGSSKNGRWMRKVTGGGGGEIWTQTGPTDPNSTWWRGVAIGPGDNIATTGDITTGVSGPVEVYARTTNAGNTSTSDANYAESGAPADLGEAIAVDSSGNTYIGGFLGIAGPSKNAVILKIPSGTTTPAQWFLETANAPSEILGLIALPDGTLYAMGYENVLAQSPVNTSPQPQGNNLVVMKIDPSGNVLWKRTYDSGHGDDQAVSATLTSTSLIVVGQISTASNGKDVFVISYMR
jgi:hypothetical protein